jgi:hypothetical protein
MSGDLLMENPIQQIKKISKVVKSRHAEQIYMEGFIPTQLWEIILDDSILGKIAPNSAVSKVVLQQIGQFEDDLLTGTIISSIKTKKTKMLL